MEEKSKWISRTIGAFRRIVSPAVLSLLAIVISITAAATAIGVYRLSMRQDLDSRRLVLIGQPNNYDEILEIRPSDESIARVWSTVSTPECAGGYPMATYHLSSAPDTSHLSRQLSWFFSEHCEDGLSAGGNSLPIVFDTEYVANNRVYRAAQLYSLEFSFRCLEDRLEPEVTLNSFHLVYPSGQLSELKAEAARLWAYCHTPLERVATFPRNTVWS